MLRACFLAASSSGDKVAVGLAVAAGALVVVGAPVPLALPLLLGVVVAFVLCVLATAALLLPASGSFCSWQSLHPARPEQASRVKANAA